MKTYPLSIMDLKEYRSAIDTIDKELIAKIAERMHISEKIAHLKKRKHIDVFQPDREIELLKKRRESAHKKGVSPELVEEIFRLIVKDSRKIQMDIISGNPLSVPDRLHLRKKKLDMGDLDLITLFEKIAEKEKNFFFLESLGEDEWSEYSFLGFDPHAVIQAKGDDCFLNGKKVVLPRDTNPFQYLKSLFEPFSGITSEKNFCGGLIGYFGTESARYYDPAIDTGRKRGDFPDFAFGLYLDGLIFDRKRNSLEYFTWGEDRSERIMKMLHSRTRKLAFSSRYLRSSFTDRGFESLVNELKEEIRAGNLFQIVPSRRFSYEIRGSLIPFYARLRTVNPSPYMYFLSFGDHQLVGSSPELVARINGKRIETFPIAGTRSRGKTPEEDAKKAAELLSDKKEVAEHMMLVDMSRNDLGRICRYGTVEVERLMSIKKFSHVQHIVSNVSGILQDDISPLDGVMSNFPMGTVSGAPRIEAMRILSKKEPVPRGPYGGTVGFWSFSGDATFVLAIRSLFVSRAVAFAQAGAGIVYDSITENERKEIDKKVRHIREILEEKREIRKHKRKKK